MPHKCVRCGKLYANASRELMQGCACGARVFVFLRDDQVTLKELSESGLELNGTRIVEPEESGVEAEEKIQGKKEGRKEEKEGKKEEKEAKKEAKAEKKEEKETEMVLVEKEPVDVSKLAWLEEELAFLTKEKPVSIDFDAVENLRVVEQGSYELNLPSLMKGDPLVVRSDSGVYYIKLPQPKRRRKK